jgi:hypothetical protein
MGLASVVIVSAYRLGLRVFQPEDYSYVKEAKLKVAGRPVVVAGAELSITGADLAKHPFSLLLVTSPNCSFCVSSGQFHRVLQSEAQKNSMPFYVALPKAERAGKYIKGCGFTRAKLKNWEDLSRRAYGTPTIVLINARGVIERVWLGALSEDKEREVLRAVANPTKLPPISRRLSSGERVLTPADVTEIAAKRDVVFLSTLERQEFAIAHIEGSINIPFEELRVRAPFELKRGRLHLVDCSVLPDMMCSQAVTVLHEAGLEAAALDTNSKS